MAYNRLTWTNGSGNALNSDNLSVFNDGIDQNNLFNGLLSNDKYKVTEFDTPTSGDITESIKLVSDDTTFATILTEFDTPASGDITTTLTCASLGLSNKAITTFDDPTSGDITETGSVV